MKKYFNLSALLLVVFVLTSYGKYSYVSANGMYTNLVYNTDLSWLYSDNRTITDLQSEVTASPDNPDLWYALGRHYMADYQLSNALVALHKTDSLAPDAIFPSLFIAECYILQDRNAAGVCR